MKFLSRLILILFIFSVVAGGIFYLYPENSKEFIVHILEEFNFNEKVIESDTSDLELDTLTLVPPSKGPKQQAKPAYKLLSLPINQYSKIDEHARNTPLEATQSIDSLAEYLKKVASKDLERARVIYVWLTENISYDDESYNSGDYGDTSAEGVLKNRKSVCDGFGELYFALGTAMGLDIKKVVGYAKGYGYSIGDEFTEIDHAWNIIKIENEWRIFDATWGEGYGENVNGSLVSTKKFDDYWFNVDPYEAIFSHFSENSKHTFVQPVIDLEVYQKLPFLDGSYFKMGFNGKEIYSMALQNLSIEFPECYEPGTYVKVLEAPKLKFLEIGKSYDFRIYVPRGYSAAAIDSDGTWRYFEREKGIFSLKYSPENEGIIKISIMHENSSIMYNSLLIYSSSAPPI